jgi:protein-tyrosine sulfotransferase
MENFWQYIAIAEMNSLTMNLGDKIIFIGGAPRSGTTLVKNILDAHPDICSGPEFDIMSEIVRVWQLGVQKVREGRISAFLNEDQLRERFASLVHSLLEPYRLRKSKLFIAEKTPGNILVYTQLNRLLPGAYLIHVIRDGRDVVSSMVAVAEGYRLAREKVPTIIRNVEACSQTWSRYVSAPFERPKVFQSTEFQRKYIEIRYEDIIRDPEATLRYVCRRLEIDFSPNMLTPHLFTHDTIIDDFWYDQKMMEGPLSQRSIGRWRRDLTLIQRLIVAHYCQTYLQRFGYTENKSWIKENMGGNCTGKLAEDVLTICRLAARFPLLMVGLLRACINKH